MDSLPAEPWGKPRNTGVGSLSLLQWIFPIQESNLGLLNYRWILYQLSYQGSHNLSPKAQRDVTQGPKKPYPPCPLNSWISLLAIFLWVLLLFGIDSTQQYIFITSRPFFFFLLFSQPECSSHRYLPGSFPFFCQVSVKMLLPLSKAFLLPKLQKIPLPSLVLLNHVMFKFNTNSYISQKLQVSLKKLI